MTTTLSSVRVAGLLARVVVATLAGAVACKRSDPAPAAGQPDTRIGAGPAATGARQAPPDPVAALAGMRMVEIQALLRPGHATAHVTRGIATLLDDQDGGADDRIDPGLETLHLATYFLNEARDALRPGCRPSRAGIERYRARVLPRSRSATTLASQLRYDVEGSELTRRSHRDRTARLWKPHFDRNRQGIMSAVALMKSRRGQQAGRPRVLVLGAGSCADIPLGELVAAGCDVVLVDLDEASMKQGIAMQVAAPDRRHVRLELRDLSEGVVDAVSAEARRIIHQHAASGAPAARARAALNALFRRQGASVPQLEGGWSVDLLVSSLLIGQLPVIPAEAIGRWFEAQFREPLARTEEDMLAQSALGDRLFDAHIEALADLVVRNRAVVYFSSDLFMMPSFYEAQGGKTRYGPPRPVLGYRGQPLSDLDLPFENNRDLEITGSQGGEKSSDLWIWNQEPAELATQTSTFEARIDGQVAMLTGKKGMVRAVDAVVLAPARRLP